MSRTMAPGHSEISGDGEVGWYLYGIVRRGAIGTDDGVPTQILECGSVAAVTTTVPISDFTDEVLQRRLRDPVTLEELATDHNDVIAAIHRDTPILPAKFGGVYARREDLLAAIDEQNEALAAQLDFVDGCDEWALSLYLNQDRFSDDIAISDPELSQLRQDLASSSPGRAYLLQRSLSDRVARGTNAKLASLVRYCFEQLQRSAVAVRSSPLRPAASAKSGEIEILRAAFLVRRDQFDAFNADVNALVLDHAGLRCERSGPWPPYSFASIEEEDSS